MNVGTHAKEFMGKEAPVGYIPGLGRGGAKGFVTGSDITPLEPTEFTAFLAQKDPLLQEEDSDESGLLSNANSFLSAEDQEAIREYERINEAMSRRKKSKRKPFSTDEGKSFVDEEFAAIKQSMQNVSAEEWANLPEAKSMAKKKKKPRELPDVPLPDTIILQGASLAGEGKFSAFAAENEEYADVSQFGSARGKALEATLGCLASSAAANSHSVNAAAYLNEVEEREEDSIGDISNARTMYKSITSSFPANVDAWIAYVRIEERARNLKEAKRVCKKALENLPNSEQLWLEYIRIVQLLAGKKEAKQLMHLALQQYVPQSTKIWIILCQAEEKAPTRRELYRKALEANPKSLELWMAFIDEEEEIENAKFLLHNALECIPEALELWIALSKMESYETARKILNKARKSCAPSFRIWLEAMKLEELNGSEFKVISNLLENSIADLKSFSIDFTSQQWFEHAIRLEKENFPFCSEAIVQFLGQDGKTLDAVLQSSTKFISQGAFHCARMVFKYALLEMPNERSLWRQAALFEQKYGNLETFEALMQNATQICPKIEIFWLIYAKTMWKEGRNPQKAISILLNALKNLPNSEEVHLALAKVYLSEKNLQKTEEIYLKIRSNLSHSPRLWCKYIWFEWCRAEGSTQKATELAKEAISLFPSFAKTRMILGQIYLADNNLSESKAVWEAGTKACPNSIPLWILLSRVERQLAGEIKARAVLEKAKLLNPKNETLWLESIKTDKILISKALKECSDSGELTFVSLMQESKHQRVFRATEALKTKPQEPWLHFALAKTFEQEKKIEKALESYKNCLENNAQRRVADFYLHYILFLRNLDHSFGAESEELKIKNDFIASNAVYGEWWISHRKSKKNWLLSNDEVLELALLQGENKFF